MRDWTAFALIVVVLAACAEPAPTQPPVGGPVIGSDTDGAFRLELALVRADWRADESIAGTARLLLQRPEPTNVYGSGAILNFMYAEVGGSRRVDPVWTADCATHTLDPASAITVGLGRSGAMADDDPNVGFLRSFLLAPDVRLPEGTWDVTALALFMEGQACSGGSHEMAATVRIVVGD